MELLETAVSTIQQLAGQVDPARLEVSVLTLRDQTSALTRVAALAVLGLDESASAEDVDHRYERLWLKLHPIQFEDLPREFQLLASVKRREVQAAYDLLTAEDDPPGPPDRNTQDLLGMRLANLQLKVRTYNALARRGIHTVRDVLARTGLDILETRNFGHTSWEDLTTRLMELVPDDHQLRHALENFVQSATALPEDGYSPPVLESHPSLEASQSLDDDEDESQESWPSGKLVDLLPRILKPRQTTVLVHRYGLDGQPRWTLQTLADSLGRTRERIRQIESKAVRQLRGHRFAKRLLAKIRAELERQSGWLRVEELGPEFDSLGEGRAGLLALAADLDQELTWYEGLKVCALENALSQWQQRKAEAQKSFLPPVPASEVITWMTSSLEAETPERLRWVLEHLWDARLLSYNSLDYVVSFERNPDIADRACLLLLNGEPCQLDALWARYAAAFPNEPGTLHSLEHAIGADDRFFLLDQGTWTLTRCLELNGELWDLWAGDMLSRLWEIGEVSNTRLLLEHLASRHASLPSWLNEHSLYWLVRRDSRFTTHRRLEVQPADADWERKGLADLVDEVLRQSRRPLTAEEIVRALEPRRPFPIVSVNQALSAGREQGHFHYLPGRGWTVDGTPTDGAPTFSHEEVEGRIIRALERRGTPVEGRELYEILGLQEHVDRALFYQVIGPSRELIRYLLDPVRNFIGLTRWGVEGWKAVARVSWSAAERAAAKSDLPEEARQALAEVARERSQLPVQAGPPDQLWEWEAHLRKRFAEVRLVGQLNITEAETTVLADRLKQQIQTYGLGRALEQLERSYPCSLATVLVFYAVYKYEPNRYWPQVCEALGLPYANTTSDLGRAFEKVLRALDLPSFETVEGARYLRCIVGHAGIPAQEVVEFYHAVVIPSVRDSSLAELAAAELLDYLAQVQLYTTQAVRWFIAYGGRFAEDMVERCRDLAREVLRSRALPQDDYGLPERLWRGMEAWLERAGDHGGHPGRSLVPRPVLSLEPWAEGLGIRFPAARVTAPTQSGMARLRWEVDDGSEILVDEDSARVVSGMLELPERFLRLDRPAREYRCSLSIDDRVEGPFPVSGFDRDQPMRFFSPRTSTAFGSRIPDRQTWVVYPSHARLTVDGAEPEILERFPDLGGLFDDYTACWLELSRHHTVALSEPRCEIPLARELPIRLEGTVFQDEDHSESGIPVFSGDPPVMEVQLGRSKGWHLQIASDWGSWRVDAAELARFDQGGAVRIPLAQVVPGMQAGEYRILLRGQLGEDSRRVFRFVPRAELFRSSVVGSRHDIMLRVPAGVQLLQDGRSQPAVSRTEADCTFRLLGSPGKIRMQASLCYPRQGLADYELPLSVPYPAHLWAVVGLPGSAGIDWSDQEIPLPVDLLERATSADLLVYSPEDAEVHLVLQGQESPAQTSRVVTADTRGRTRIPLRPWLDTLRAEPRIRIPIGLRIGQAQYQALCASRQWDVSGFEASVTGSTVSLSWHESFPTEDRRLRLWDLCRPWSEPRRLELDEAGSAQLILSPEHYPPGLYLAELYTEDPWLSGSRGTPVRPPRLSPTCATFWSREEEVARLLESRPASGLECLEHFLMRFERGMGSHSTLFDLGKVLRSDELPLLIRALIRLGRESRAQHADLRVAVDQFFVEALKDRMSEVLPLLPGLASQGEGEHLVAFLLRLGLSVDKIAPADLSARSKEALWCLWPPLGLGVELAQMDAGSSDRLTRYLGRFWESLRARPDLVEWGRCPGPEVSLPVEQLTEIWRSLEVTPAALLDPQNLQRCYFHTYRDLQLRRQQQDARAWIQTCAGQLENELDRLFVRGLLAESTYRSLWERHPVPRQGGLPRGDAAEPLAKLPFMVGTLSMLQRLAAHDSSWSLAYPRADLLAQTMQCHRFAPELMTRDLCQAELAVTPLHVELETE